MSDLALGLSGPSVPPGAGAAAETPDASPAGSRSGLGMCAGLAWEVVRGRIQERLDKAG